MTLLFAFRHAATDWTAERRLQGRTDRPLSDEGRRQAAGWRLPAEIEGFRWLSSPLSRCRETAEAMGATPLIEPALVEMGWGAWEGRRLADLRADLGPAMAENEAGGLDFRPEGGESPRMVQGRLLPFLAGLDADSVAVAHKGVLRALYSLATGWDMTGKPPDRLLDGHGHLFRMRNGKPEAMRLNQPLTR